VSAVDPVWADRIRKVVAGGLALVGTVLLFRILARLAAGTERWPDPELGALAAIVVVVVWWVRAARRMPRQAGRPRAEEPRADHDRSA